jgi:hypothetical protein
MSLNKYLDDVVNAALLLKAEDSLEKHQECLSAAVSDLIKAKAPASEIAIAAYICGHAHCGLEIVND